MHSVLIAAFAALTSCHAANILILQPVPIRSHYYVFDSLAVQLARKGHRVTFLTPYKHPRYVPNLVEIRLDDTYEKIVVMHSDPSKDPSILKHVISPWERLVKLPRLGRLMTLSLLESSTMRNFLEKKQKFDVLISNTFFGEGITAGLSYKYGVPIIAVAPFGTDYWSNHLKMHYVLIAAFATLTPCHAANILILQPLGIRSHYYLFDSVAVQLARKGHNVTFLAPFKHSRSVPNLVEIQLDDTYEKMIEIHSVSSKDPSILRRVISPWSRLFRLPMMGRIVSAKILESPSMKNFLEKEQKFDVLITNTFFAESIIAGLSYKYGVPIIAVNPFRPGYWSNHLVGNPAPTSFVPDTILGYTGKMNLFERLSNTVFYYLKMLHTNYFHLPAEDVTFKKFFGPETPHITQVLRNTSLVLVNQHFSAFSPTPYLSNMFEIGGHHVPPVGQLPQDLQKIMDESEHGVILFSMGSHLKGIEMSKGMVQEILKALSRLKQTILWKYEDDSLISLPKNVIIRKWLPQSDILAHPNMKLFITQGGILSMFEALYHGVPLVGIPVVTDQPINVRLASENGYAVTLDLRKLDEHTLYAAVTEVLSNPKYAENAKKRSFFLKDRPLTATDTAMYWIEYVIRHGGAPQLRSTSQDLTWYQLHSVDVFCVLCVLLFTFIFTISLIIKVTWITVFRIFNKSKKGTSSKKLN